MEPKLPNKLPESAPRAKTVFIQIAPGMPPEQLDAVTANSDAVVLTVFATGTSPESLNGVIKQRTDEGTPVFLVSNNPQDAHGILKSTYDPQEYSAGAGGTALGKAVQEKFAYKEDEPKPVASWNDPAQVDEQEQLYAKTLRRNGTLNEQEITQTLKQWRGEGI